MNFYKKYVSVFMCIIMIAMISGCFNSKVNAATKVLLPKISKVEVSNKQMIITTKDYKGMVQYQVCYKKQSVKNSKWNVLKLTGMRDGWTKAIQGNKVMKLNLSSLNINEFKDDFSVRVKRYGMKGIHKDKVGQYDNYYLVFNNKKETAKQIIKEEDKILNLSLKFSPMQVYPLYIRDECSNQIASEIYEGLTRMEQRQDGTNYIAPAGAYKWEVNETGDVWTFHLREHYWSDGVKVTAKHYVDSILKSLEPDTSSIYSHLLYPIKNAKNFNLSNIKDSTEVGVRAIDFSTLQITLEKPCPHFIELTYLNIMKPQRLDIIDKYKNSYNIETKNIICNGPFIVKLWEPQNKIILDKNESYWDKDKVKLKQINFNIIHDENERFNALYNSNIDIVTTEKFIPEWSEKFKSANKYNFINRDNGMVSFTIFNHKDKYFANNKIRKAFILAEIRNKQDNNLFNQITGPAYNFCPPSIQINGESFRSENEKLPVLKLMEEYKDPKALLIEGLREIGEDADPAKVDITLLVADGDKKDGDRAEFIKKHYKEALGIDIKIKYNEWAMAMKNMSCGEYQITSLSYISDYNSPITYLECWKSSDETFNTAFNNKKYDELVYNASISIDATKQLEDLKKAEDILIYEEGAMSPISFRKLQIISKKNIKNIMYNPFSKFEFKYVDLDK